MAKHRQKSLTTNMPACPTHYLLKIEFTKIVNAPTELRMPNTACGNTYYKLHFSIDAA